MLADRNKSTGYTRPEFCSLALFLIKHTCNFDEIDITCDSKVVSYLQTIEKLTQCTQCLVT